jgi:hypothetical protein
MVSEGGFESTTRTLLTLMENAGIVRRFKPQPFKLTEIEHGLRAIPDFIFEMDDGKQFVVEVKTKRFMTEDVLRKCRAVERVINASGMKYLLWTDAWPLNRDLWHILRHIRRAGMSAVPRNEIDRLVQVVGENGKTVAELRTSGYFSITIHAAAWEARVGFDILSPWSDSTVVSREMAKFQFFRTLTTAVDSHSVWNSLDTPSSPLKTFTYRTVVASEKSTNGNPANEYPQLKGVHGNG